MKNVLIALDYGLSARTVAEKGYELAKSMKANVTLLHVVADATYYSAMDTTPFMSFYGYNFFDTEASDNLIQSSLKFLDKIKSHLKASEIETVAEQGDFATIILEEAKKLKADIIVIGSHSKNWLEKAVMGSVTESVLEKATIPLFIVPIREHK